MDQKRLELEESHKFAVIGFLLTLCLLATFYFHFIEETEIIFTHFFYVPIILAGLWWSRKGIVVAVFLASLLLFSHSISPLGSPTWADGMRSVMFVVVGTIVGILSEKRQILADKLQEYSRTLEHLVAERTSELRESEERQRAVLDGIGDAVTVLDEDQNIIWANEIAVKQYGAIIGRKCYEAYKWRNEPCHDCIARKAFVNGGSRTSEEEGILKDGTRVNFIVSCSPVRDPEGKVVSVVEVLHDITKRKRMEEVLRESEEEYRSLVESTADSVYLVDRDCRYLFMNERHLSRLGLPAERIISRTYGELHSPEEEEKFAEKVNQVFETRESVTHEHKSRRDSRYILRTLSPVKEQNGRVAAVTVVSKDITERKRAEEQLKETGDYLDNIIKSSADAITVVDMNEIVQNWTKGAEGIMGYRADEVIGTSSKKFFADPKEADRIMDLVQRDGEIKNRRTIVLRKDGKPVHISMSAALLKDKDGVPIGTVRVNRDITKVVELEERVKAERDNLQSIFESMADSIYVVSKEYRIEFMNRALRDEFSDRVGSICYKTFHNRDEPCPRCKISEVMGGKTVQWEWHSRRANKTFDLIETPLTNVDGTISKLTIFREITERKKAETDRERLLKELEAKNTELDRFTYTVSHDLKSPLVSIKGFAGMLREDMGRNDVEKVESDLKYIETAATKMDKFLRDTLELSRIGRVAHPPEDVPFCEILQDALEQTKELLQSNNIEVSVAEDFPTVHVDRMRIVEVLVNLITNSINYMGEETQPKIDLGYRADGEETVFFVQDNGMGIDPSQHEKVFGLFYKEDSSSKGTGAGLAIVKRIMEVHNGRVWIESEKGRGCTICFTLPIR